MLDREIGAGEQNGDKSRLNDVDEVLSRIVSENFAKSHMSSQIITSRLSELSIKEGVNSGGIFFPEFFSENWGSLTSFFERTN
jgi:hypothetical protein